MRLEDPKAASDRKPLSGAVRNPSNRSRRRRKERATEEESLRARRAQHFSPAPSLARIAIRPGDSATRNPILEGSENCSHRRDRTNSVLFDG